MLRTDIECPQQFQPSGAPEWKWPAFLGLLILQLWVAHACVFFAHEFAHSFTAWILGWKSNPLALNYAHPTLTVFLIQLGIDQNVDELPIFASHHGAQAAIISAAGAVLGNALLTYTLSRWGYGQAKKHAARGWAMFWYWICVASVGNLIDYVPIRTFTDGTDLYQDMYAVERGFGWSPWTLLIAFGIPAAIVLVYFILRIEPDTLRWLFPRSMMKRGLLAVLTAFILFDFYGAAGLAEGGPISHKMSILSMCVVAPLMAIVGLISAARSPRHRKRVHLALGRPIFQLLRPGQHRHLHHRLQLFA